MGKIKDLILEQFPSRERLSYEDFIHDELVEYYYGDEKRISTVFEYISRPWEDIPWDLIERVSFDGEDCCSLGYLVTGHLNEKSFIHVFPSLLNEVAGEGTGSSLASDHFVYTHLDLRAVFKDWELEFYFSLSEDVVKLVNLVLRTNGDQWALDAIDVYWH